MCRDFDSYKANGIIGDMQFTTIIEKIKSESNQYHQNSNAFSASMTIKVSVFSIITLLMPEFLFRLLSYS